MPETIAWTKLRESENVVVEVCEGLARITLRREKQLNALSSSFFAELEDAWVEVESCEEARVAVIVSAHHKAFIAGADISEMQGKSAAQMASYAARGQAFMRKIEASHIVSVAAVNGFCLGGGFEVALACDLIAAGPGAAFAFPEIGLGLLPGFGGTQRFARTAGQQQALRYILTGERFKSEAAERMGLLWKTFDNTDTFNEDVVDAARPLSEQASGAMAAIKRLVRLAMWTDIDSGCAAEVDAFGLNASTADAQEGLSAFLEKRTPKFTGNK